MLRGVVITRDVLWGCTTHALTTEHEEILGLLLGTIEDRVAHITRSQVLTRKIKLKDRVEVGYEDLATASELAEQFSESDGAYCRVLGWYHSHPHITVFPSHVDVRTQSQYQQLDSHFIGLIFSVFDRNVNSVCAFQSVETAENGWQKLEIPISIEASLGRRIDSLLSLQLEFLNDNYKSYVRAMKEVSPLEAVEIAALHSSSMCSVLHNMSLPLLMALKSKKESMMLEKTKILATIKQDSLVSCNATEVPKVPTLSVETSSLLWSNTIEFIKTANEGMKLTIQYSDMSVCTDCILRIMIATYEACTMALEFEHSGLSYGNFIKQILEQRSHQRSGRFTPWLCQYGPHFASLKGILFSNVSVECLSAWAKLSIITVDGISDTITILFNRENSVDRRMEDLFRNYFASAFVAIDIASDRR